MKREEKLQYMRDYRAEGFGRISDKRYYAKNAERLRAESKLRYLRRKAKKVSRETPTDLDSTK